MEFKKGDVLIAKSDNKVKVKVLKVKRFKSGFIYYYMIAPYINEYFWNDKSFIENIFELYKGGM